ncbi:ABC transporter ATP-binding protein [Actinomadura rubrisoli]|uniref:ABC transporter ATP-binding protein n=1 Tax=Actinomadura rubrisoli TaxID=2530368 RepID=A0A4R5BZP0_9ACTN|nr:ABC transporter ATP-binding protein [Actinomadura rubrisoli]TDD91865.1 ABC transporter ATP-binding protein [Actinomadura rubrisoli]
MTAGYDRRTVIGGLDLDVPDGSFTVIVGPNACGKSTLLHTLARVLRPKAGTVLLDGAAIARLPSKEVARRLGLLAQQPVTPDAITVADLVSRGRHPHRRALRGWSREDDAAVARALAATDTAALAGRQVDELSGGQRQRVWLAMVLAQDTPIMLLDEPTTFLDISHQIDMLDLCASLHEDHARTLVVVLHDLNHACRYATHLIAMRDGAVIAQGPPDEIVTPALIEEVFGLRCQIIPDPVTGTPLVVPLSRRHARRTADL